MLHMVIAGLNQFCVIILSKISKALPCYISTVVVILALTSWSVHSTYYVHIPIVYVFCQSNSGTMLI